MAPTYRNANRRQNRPGLDHGEYEGIPIRHWRRDFVTVAPPPTQDNTPQNDIWAVELPHGMPKDSHLMPQHSQDLLRAARSGKIYKRPAPADEEEADPEVIIGDKPEKKDEDIKEKGFMAKSWKQVARHLEGPDVVYLAKRRKGLVTASSKPVPIPTVTKATVKRIDAAGNEYVQDVVVPQGQVVEGEVLSQIQIPDPTAPVGLAQVQATPPRARPKPKKKAKGPGRGRKKKPIAPTSVPQLPLAEGAAPLPTSEGAEGASKSDEVKAENGVSSTPALPTEDTEMGDGSAANSDDEDGEDGEDGDEGDDDEGSVDIQDSPSKPSQQSPSATSTPNLPPIPPLPQPDFVMGGTEFSQAPPRLMTDRLEAKSGSPLKNVVMPTSALTSPLEPPANPSPTKEFADSHPLASDSTPFEEKLEILDQEMQQEVPALVPEDLPAPPPEPTNVEMVAAIEERVEEEEEEEMLLDILDRARNSEVGAPVDEHTASTRSKSRSAELEAELNRPEPVEVEVEPVQMVPQPEIVPEVVQEKSRSPEKQATPMEREITPAPIPSSIAESAPEPPLEATSEPLIQVQEPPTADEEDDDDGFDLLGGLEKSLKTPEARGETPAAHPVPEKTPEAQRKPEETTDEPVIAQENTTAEEVAKENEPDSQESDMLV